MPMPTPEQIEVMAETVLRETDYSAIGQEAHDMLRTIAAEMRKSEPEAKMQVHTSGAIGIGTVDNDRIAHNFVAGEYFLYTHPSADAEDARRYRWLRTKREDIHDGLPFVISYHSGCNYIYDSGALDKAIDAAMLGEK